MADQAVDGPTRWLARPDAINGHDASTGKPISGGRFGRVVVTEEEDPGAVLNAQFLRVTADTVTEIHTRHLAVGDYSAVSVDRWRRVVQVDQVGEQPEVRFRTQGADLTFDDVKGLAAALGGAP